MPREHKYWTYIVASTTGTLYIGMTNSLERRIAEHKEGRYEGFASKYGCDRLVYWESFEDVRKAIDREKELKGMAPGAKDCLDRIVQPALGTLGGETGMEDAVAAERDPGSAIVPRVVILSAAKNPRALTLRKSLRLSLSAASQ